MRHFVTVLWIAVGLVAAGAVEDDDGIGGIDVVTGNDGSGVVVEGSRDSGGEPGTSPIDNDWQPPLEDSWTPPKETEIDRCLRDWESYRGCYAAERPEDVIEEEETPALPAISITDLARFAPGGTAITGEPDNVGVAGLPTNFVATASEQTVQADLFGFPVSVRFTPAAYDFTFGDGSSQTSTTGGTSWADLGQAQFTPTGTSHTYRERGSYPARVDVRYTAEVDFGVGWFPISGQVTSTGAPQEIRIFEAHTALVAHTCAQAPSSPGC